MSSLPSLVIVGAGGLGKEVAALVETINEATPTWTLTGFADDAEELQETSVLGYPVRGSTAWLARQTDLRYVLAVGSGQDRRALSQRLAPSEVQPATLVPPSLSIHRTTELGPGTILCRGAAPTVDLTIGSHVVIDQECTIGHDSRLDAFVTLHPGARISGAVHLERGVTVGAGAVVLPEVHVGARTTIGAGAVVTEDLPPDCTAVGMPARPQS